MATVSIVMATFQGARFIDRQLASLAAQEHPPLELIVSDDASNDGTIARAEAFARHAPFPVIISRNETRLGYGENFLRAARLARGDYIAFCDQDDVWHPSKLALAVATLSRTGAMLFAHAIELIDEEERKIGDFAQGITATRVHGPLQLDPWAVFYGLSVVFRRDLIDLIDPRQRGWHIFRYNELLSHDMWVYFLANSLGDVAVERTPLVRYRQHRDNQTPHVRLSRLAALRASLGAPANPRLRRGEIAAHRQALLDRLAAETPASGLRDAAARAAAYWRRIAAYEAARLQFYQGDGLPRRALGCVRLVLSGGYRPFHGGGLGRRLLVKDALVGVIRAVRTRDFYA